MSEECRRRGRPLQGTADLAYRLLTGPPPMLPLATRSTRCPLLGHSVIRLPRGASHEHPHRRRGARSHAQVGPQSLSQPPPASSPHPEAHHRRCGRPRTGRQRWCRGECLDHAVLDGAADRAPRFRWPRPGRHTADGSGHRVLRGPRQLHADDPRRNDGSRRHQLVDLVRRPLGVGGFIGRRDRRLPRCGLRSGDHRDGDRHHGGYRRSRCGWSRRTGRPGWFGRVWRVWWFGRV